MKLTERQREYLKGRLEGGHAAIITDGFALYRMKRFAHGYEVERKLTSGGDTDIYMMVSIEALFSMLERE